MEGTRSGCVERFLCLPPKLQVRKGLILAHRDLLHRRAGHEVEADPGTASGLWVLDHVAECCSRADPPEGHAGDPDNR
jgi:hypothetical protein